MLSDVVQRWNNGRGSLRPAHELINTSELEVAPIADDTTAKRYVVQHHYSHAYPAARFRFGLYLRSELVGVAVFSHPVNGATFNCLPGEVLDKVELGRFVLADKVRGNGESWFIARCFEGLRRAGIVGVVSFSDPMPRERIDGVGGTDGRVVHAGHIGIIYQATNAVYLGQAHADTVHLLPDGRTLSRRAIDKLRKGARGWNYVAETLVAAGATPFDGSASWPERALADVTRKVRHPGNHKYIWPLRFSRRALSRHLDGMGLSPKPYIKVNPYRLITAAAA